MAGLSLSSKSKKNSDGWQVSMLTRWGVTGVFFPNCSDGHRLKLFVIFSPLVAHPRRTGSCQHSSNIARAKRCVCQNVLLPHKFDFVLRLNVSVASHCPLMATCLVAFHVGLYKRPNICAVPPLCSLPTCKKVHHCCMQTFLYPFVMILRMIFRILSCQSNVLKCTCHLNGTFLWKFEAWII